MDNGFNSLSPFEIRRWLEKGEVFNYEFYFLSSAVTIDLKLVHDFIDKPWVWSILSRNNSIMKEANERIRFFENVKKFNLCPDIDNIIYKFLFYELKDEKLLLKRLYSPNDNFYSYEEPTFLRSMTLRMFREKDRRDYNYLSFCTTISLNFVDEFIDKPWNWGLLPFNHQIVREFKKRDCVYKIFNEMGFSEYEIDLISDFSFHKLNNRKLIWEKLKI